MTRMENCLKIGLFLNFSRQKARYPYPLQWDPNLRLYHQYNRPEIVFIFPIKEQRDDSYDQRVRVSPESLVSDSKCLISQPKTWLGLIFSLHVYILNRAISLKQSQKWSRPWTCSRAYYVFSLRLRLKLRNWVSGREKSCWECRAREMNVGHISNALKTSPLSSLLLSSFMHKKELLKSAKMAKSIDQTFFLH